MKTLSASELVATWERTIHQSPVQQALGLLSTAFPEYSPDQLARLRIGKRDALLFTLRERLFGSSLSGVVLCPKCRQRIELHCEVSDLRVEPAVLDVVNPDETVMMLTMEGYRVEFRAPNSVDMTSIEAGAAPNETQMRLLAQCIRSIARTGKRHAKQKAEADIRQLPLPVIEAITERMAQADPQADTQLALTCPDCCHAWCAPFDIVTYLIDEIHRLVQRILEEVHTLARAYGWHESDILSMTPTRRRTYLELLGRA